MEVKLKNYRCFKDATLRLAPLTVLVGANASGKSSLVRALNPEFRLHAGDVWQGRSELAVVVERQFDNSLGLRAMLNVGASENAVAFEGAASPAPTFQLLELIVGALRTSNQVTKETKLGRDGSNLTNVFGTLTRVQQAELSRRFCSLVPVYSDVDTVPHFAGQITLRFQDRWNSTRWYQPQEVSDGTLFTLAFLLLAHQTPPVDILVIEDPEHGLHPFLLGEIVDLLRKLATGELTGRSMRVVLTTHSPTVLEFVQPEEVRLLQRQDDGSVEILEIPTGTEQWRSAFKVYDESLGQAWLSGGLGGTP